MRGKAAEHYLTREENGTIIFRAGSKTYLNLTPKEKDLVSTKGLPWLSMFNSYVAMALAVTFTKVCITTIEIVQSTGILSAVNDHDSHVAVFPTDGNLFSWVASRATAEVSPDARTLALYNAVVCV